MCGGEFVGVSSMRYVTIFLSALLFGVGLVVSGMSNPAKVANFLDLAGHWDLSLAFVMAGALAVAAPGYALVLRRARPTIEDKFSLPTKKDLEPRLFVGAGVFGVGWALAGLCPGPAFTTLTTGGMPALLFVATMFAGLFLARRMSAG